MPIYLSIYICVWCMCMCTCMCIYIYNQENNLAAVLNELFGFFKSEVKLKFFFYLEVSPNKFFIELAVVLPIDVENDLSFDIVLPDLYGPLDLCPDYTV